MLVKKYVAKNNVCEVTFCMPENEVPPGIIANSVTLAGEFNEWDTEATPMLFDEASCAYQVTLPLDPDATYQYRFVINNDHWYNDWEADAYTPNSFGCDNCVVETLGSDDAAE